MSETVVIIRPSFKKICGDNDACRAAVFNQMLYNIAWKVKQGASYWYGTAKDIWAAVDRSWGLSKVIQEINALVRRGLLGQQYNPKHGGDRTYQYFFGPEQAQNLQTYAREHGIEVEGLGLPTDVFHLLEITNGNSGNNSSMCLNQHMETVKPTHGIVKSNVPFVESTKTLPKGPTKDTPKIPSKGQAKEGEAPSLPKQQPITEPLPAVPLPSLSEEKELSWETITPQTPHCSEVIMLIATHYLGAAKVTQADAEAFLAKTQSIATLTGSHEVRRQLVKNITFLLYSQSSSNWFSKGNRRDGLTFSKVVAWYDDYNRKSNAAGWEPPMDKVPGWYHLDETLSHQQEGGREGEDYLSGMDEQEAQTLTARILAEYPGMKITWGNLPHGRCTVGLDMGEGYWLDLYKAWEWAARGDDPRFGYVLEAYEQTALAGVA
jgi:hypothetical protein